MREIKYIIRIPNDKSWKQYYANVYADKFPITACDNAKKIMCEFTGMKDKNGKEIYEGDIVLQVGYNNKLIPMLVRFENGAFIVGYHKGSSTRKTPMLLSNKCEVIGNVFDNPELLKENK